MLMLLLLTAAPCHCETEEDKENIKCYTQICPLTNNWITWIQPKSWNLLRHNYFFCLFSKCSFQIFLPPSLLAIFLMLLWRSRSFFQSMQKKYLSFNKILPKVFKGLFTQRLDVNPKPNDLTTKKVLNKFPVPLIQHHRTHVCHHQVWKQTCWEHLYATCHISCWPWTGLEQSQPQWDQRLSCSQKCQRWHEISWKILIKKLLKIWSTLR